MAVPLSPLQPPWARPWPREDGPTPRPPARRRLRPQLSFQRVGPSKHRSASLRSVYVQGRVPSRGVVVIGALAVGL